MNKSESGRGNPAPQKRRKIDWAKYDPFIGVLRDFEVAKLVPCARTVVKQRREKLNIPILKIEYSETRICPICKNEFQARKTYRKKTCSPDCLKRYNSRSRIGRAYSLKSDKGLALIKKKKTIGLPKGFSKKGTAALRNNPRTGSFETHYKAQYWKLKAPNSVIYEVVNLNLWCKNNTHLFNMKPDEYNKIRAGFMQIKRYMQGKVPRGSDSYKGWLLLEWESIKEEVYSVKEVSKIFNLPESLEEQYKFFKNSLPRKATTIRNGELLYYKSAIDALIVQKKSNPAPGHDPD